ncbi:GapS6b family protein [Pseudomonas syringae]|uniref:ATP-dependent exoDNAse beta subunit n=1 Tax=Pseudomonas syringae pv. actinidiae TaxID=103796 RepID=A0A2V0QHU7_PSESF|nr:hypothetical protein [Pseudomonas syringae]BBI43286.1 hypothetical protein KPSA1B_102012 [Pseudomonas syringae pv. actinidiae]GBH08792.1 ATP-dependent exoDNAse beta subunit [Pseudomonas syringae pv. actinidiae]
MASLEQHHSGDGDNVAGNKIINHVRLLAPGELAGPIELVFESLRQKNKPMAKAQMGMLKAMPQHVEESAALVEVISIYGGLVDDQDRDAAWTAVAKVVSRATTPVIRDICQAALLQLAFDEAREREARDLYLAETSPGEYAQEAYLRRYANEDHVRTAAKGFPPEGVLTGVVEAAIRLQLSQLALEQANRLNSLYGSYNAKVLLAMATGLSLNPDLREFHFWLNRAAVKARMDGLREMVIELLQESGTDPRLHDLGCSIFKIYQGSESRRLFNALKQHVQYMDAARSDEVARFMALAGETSHLSQPAHDVQAASEDPQLRQDWCRTFLRADAHPIEEVGPFLHLANPGELKEWLTRDRLLAGGSAMEESYIRLLANVHQRSSNPDDVEERHQISELVGQFVSAWESELHHISPGGTFELAERLLILDLPHLALRLIQPLMPSHQLWASPYVLTYMRCLLEAKQNKSFDEVISRVADASSSLTLLSFQSVHAEHVGNIDAAFAFSRMMIELASDEPYGWYRQCYLLGHYRDLAEQREFHGQIPDSVLLTPSQPVKGILFFMVLAGSFAQAESRWIDWMIQSPREHAVDFVNFHFGLIFRKCESMEISSSVNQCIAAVQYRYEKDSLIRLVVDADQTEGEYTIKAASPIGQMMLRLSSGESEILQMTTYTLEENLPPYIACLRIALQLRGLHNDGSDVFSMMHMPADPAEFIPLLEEKMAHSNRHYRNMRDMEAIPLYMRGHGLYPSDSFKAAFACWTDAKIPKPTLSNIGEEKPTSMVLDAFGISYLAVTDLAKCLLDNGVTFVVSKSTMEALKQFFAEISDEKYMTLAVDDAGKLSRTTANDLRQRDGHVLTSLKLIIESAEVVRPVVHDELLEVFAINDSLHTTVYDAMQLSVANRIPWFCMDEAYGALHNIKGHPLVNLQALLLNATATLPFDFEQRRHSLLLYAFGALPITLTFNDIYGLARTPSSLAGLLLLKIIQNYGREIFAIENRPLILLNAIYLHMDAMFGREALAVSAKYSPWLTYTSHVFNHGVQLYLDISGEGSAEWRFARALNHFMQLCNGRPSFTHSLASRFVEFAFGHLMDWGAVKECYLEIVAQGSVQEPGE